MAEEKIPVLTDVYKPKADQATMEITSDLVAKVTAKVKPRLESEITSFVIEELKAEIKRAHNDVIASTQDFVDKTKADLKTEMPKMYRDSLKLAQVDIDVMKKEVLDGALSAVRKEVQDFQQQVVTEHQQQINEKLSLIAKDAESSAAEEIGMMHTRVGTLQQEAFAKLKEAFNVEREAMLNAAKNDIQAMFTAQITEGQNALKQNIEELVNKAIPNVENRVRTQLTSELQQLLLQVKFVLPD